MKSPALLLYIVTTAGKVAIRQAANRLPMSALGQKPTYAPQQAMSALHPIATAKAKIPQKAMSALPPKADMCGATRDVRFGPKADIVSFDNFVGERQYLWRKFDAKSLCGPQVDDQFKLC
jgi:hypothetical protein